MIEQYQTQQKVKAQHAHSLSGSPSAALEEHRKELNKSFQEIMDMPINLKHDYI